MWRLVSFRDPSRIPSSKFFALDRRLASSQTLSQKQQPTQHQDSVKRDEGVPVKNEGKKKTTAELDAELRLKMSGLAGDGGEAGVEYENGKPVAMKRSVKENMFRYI
ncbi:hypothetical protein GGS26DRAFT_589389 [Hypomontagnella submonticulosa]|nr:hypothetical protein GGS26DRAFT_589389 [Hypomontagnella submonticulosa]